MDYRLIHLFADASREDDVTEIVEAAEPRNWWRLEDVEGGDEKQAVYVLVLHSAKTQDLLDGLQNRLGDEEWRYVATESATVMPEIEDADAERIEAVRAEAANEEIYSHVKRGAELTRDYLLMTMLATIVAAIGLASDQVAVVIGAMVIAPLLSPIMAFAFGTTLGNFEMLRVALRSLGAGLAVAAAAGIAFGTLVPIEGGDLLAQYDRPLTLGTIALPLASGAAAALMVAKGNHSTLVGVMVAAALLPPLAAAGLLAGDGRFASAGRAAGIVVVNVVGINLACQAVFWLKGIRPGHWLSDSHPGSVRWALGGSAALLALCVAAVLGLGLWQGAPLLIAGSGAGAGG